jgi:hypothetical protein
MHLDKNIFLLNHRFMAYLIFTNKKKNASFLFPQLSTLNRCYLDYNLKMVDLVAFTSVSLTTPSPVP